MKKSTLSVCFAFLTASGAACAQSSVTLYGIVDTDINYVNHVPNAQGKSSSQIQMASGGEFGSRFGFRGNEDLGSGYAAIFQLEDGFTLNNGAATDSTLGFARLAYVGIASPYGTVAMGRQYSAMYDTIAPFIPLGRSLTFEPYNQMVDSYINNSIKYVGTYRGFTFEGLAALGGVAGNFRSSASYSIGFGYTNGPFAIGLSADQSNNAASTTAPIGIVGKVIKLDAAASYSVSQAKMIVGFKWGKTQNTQAVVSQLDTLYWTSLQYNFKPELRATLAYYYQNLISVNGKPIANPGQLTLQVNYFLSKSTALYAAASHTWHSAMNFASVSTLAVGENDQTGVAIGLQHHF